ncbi:MAG TPA: DUF6776 family protein [Xanthomonadales bacterium]|nr:DUF6776 family protein [Xanthomonadales bacterium]
MNNEQQPAASPPQKPRRNRWHLLLKGLLSLGVIYAVHAITVRWAEPELEAKKVRIRALRAEVKELGRRVETSAVRQKMAERQVEVLRQANNLLRQEESNRQAEMQRLHGEVDFYQRLTGTSGSQDGLAVYELELQTTASPQVYRYVLTLTQNLRRSAMVSGTASLELEGTRQDKPVTLKWKDLNTGNTNRPEFRFKYFQQLDGYLTVPGDFHPERVRVALNAKGSKNDVSRDFSWDDLMLPAISAPLPADLVETTESLEKEVQSSAQQP